MSIDQLTEKEYLREGVDDDRIRELQYLGRVDHQPVPYHVYYDTQGQVYQRVQRPRLGDLYFPIE